MDDKDHSLHELSLVDIANERNQQKHLKYLSFIRRLQCLRPEGLQLRRKSVNAFCGKQYVALSYTWDPSEYEDGEFGRYHVEDWDDNRLEPSKVRNCVLDRVIGYMRHVNVQLFWIDQHCIRQDTCSVSSCTLHMHCKQKPDAMQVMDLVYQLSTHPVALLGRPLQTEPELFILARVLSGRLVDRYSRLRLSRGTTIHEARKALSLLHEITQDLWWRRAWTFQENYRGGAQMELLIRHDPPLEHQKLDYGLFDKLPGELCVKSVTFSTEATRLCLAFRRTAGEMLPEDISCISDVLRAAGRYTDMLHEASPMTPTVVADIEARGLSDPWDRLPIIANCCQYPIRLDGEKLRLESRSLSLSVLAMCLLNGEILNNSDDDPKPVATLTASKFFEEQLFKAFSAPEDYTRKLTFNKGCRFTDSLWIDNPNGRLTLDQRKDLLRLVLHLRDLEHYPLARRIDEYLVNDANARGAYTSFTEEHFHCMASELAAAIRARRKLRLGCIWDPTGNLQPYSAVFVWPNKDGGRDKTYPPTAFAFTSVWFRDQGSEVHDANDIDRHVSFEVEKPVAVDGTPQLRIRRWLLGMCFFDECPRTKVVFPWPRALQAVMP
ncbi:hypothetical protein B0I35DRAFT_490832 [Stachybotrys elegans]|uniref:Heterokaryon incompatibility domain-containing protein n=1 Tax=Stachybotrys elegans TaxID=80388 RepID=A0A8K0SIB9_9HYPO|nr:hypothetical protein B0I35DRAFT_490832 [Stachybotrys elegans]